MIGLEYILEITGKSHTELAIELGIKRQNINQWIKGKSNIPKKYISTLSKIFNIYEDLFQRELIEEDKIKIQQIKLENDKLNNNISLKEKFIIEVEKEIIPNNALIIADEHIDLYKKFEILLKNTDPKILGGLLDNLIKMSNIKIK